MGNIHPSANEQVQEHDFDADRNCKPAVAFDLGLRPPRTAESQKDECCGDEDVTFDHRHHKLNRDQTEREQAHHGSYDESQRSAKIREDT